LHAGYSNEESEENIQQNIEEDQLVEEAHPLGQEKN
jgi:hypothetical protein